VEAPIPSNVLVKEGSKRFYLTVESLGDKIQSFMLNKWQETNKCLLTRPANKGCPNNSLLKIYNLREVPHAEEMRKPLSVGEV
jgi:hypothetical protein